MFCVFISASLKSTFLSYVGSENRSFSQACRYYNKLYIIMLPFNNISETDIASLSVVLLFQTQNKLENMYELYY